MRLLAIMTRYLAAALLVLAAVTGCRQLASEASPPAAGIAPVPALARSSSQQAIVALPPGLSAIKPFAGSTGQVYDWEQLLLAMENADVIILGESHTDARGHAIQAELITAALQRWDNMTLSLEEFDRSQQATLDAFQRGELSAKDLQAIGDFVTPAVRNNWMDWSLPKLEAARKGNATLLASNAPLQYSRLVRNVGCDNLPELPMEERTLFECPAASEDPVYKARFVASLTSAVSRSKPQGLKPLGAAQTDRMFRSQRVWDATMADSIVQARAAGSAKVLHVVGNVHADFNGGLVQELRYRDPDSRVLVISLVPTRSARLLDADRGRADFIIYTRQ
jgi:uncharacterized iron-regulated protein